jgi:hypothetical protein
LTLEDWILDRWDHRKSGLQIYGHFAPCVNRHEADDALAALQFRTVRKDASPSTGRLTSYSVAVSSRFSSPAPQTTSESESGSRETKTGRDSCGFRFRTQRESCTNPRSTTFSAHFLSRRGCSGLFPLGRTKGEESAWDIGSRSTTLITTRPSISLYTEPWRRVLV